MCVYVCVHIYKCSLAVARNVSEHSQPLPCASFALEYIYIYVYIYI